MDKVEMKEIVDNIDNFVEKLGEDTYNWIQNHIISRQLNYWKELTSNISESKIIILGDFFENYNVVVQNKIQSTHWTDTQITLHKMVIYCKKRKETYQYELLFYKWPPSTQHSKCLEFQKQLMREIKAKILDIKKYKNDFSFMQSGTFSWLVMGRIHVKVSVEH